MRHRLLARALPAFVLIAALGGPALAQDGLAYQQPPAPIADILDRKPTPTPSLSPDRTTLALFDRANLPPIAELAEAQLLQPVRPEVGPAAAAERPRDDGTGCLRWLLKSDTF